MKSTPFRPYGFMLALTAALSACGPGTPPTPANEKPLVSIKTLEGNTLTASTYLAPTASLVLNSSDSDGSITKIQWTIDSKSGEFTGTDIKGRVELPLAGLSNGVHNVSVTVTDNNGATATTSATFKVDAISPIITTVTLNDNTVAPGSSTSLTVGDAARVTATATDDRGDNTTAAPTVSIYEGGTLRAAGAPGAGTVTADLSKGIDGKERAAGTVSFSVVAVDAAGNTTTTSFTVNFAAATPGDTTEPVFTWLTPSTPFVSGNGTVTLRATAMRSGQDISGQITYSATCGSVSGNIWTLGADCADGSRQTVTATVVTGGKTYTSNQQITVDASNPTVQITTPSEGIAITANPVKVSVNATDLISGIASVLLEASKDGGTYQQVGVLSTGSGEMTWAPGNGTYTLRATATDKTGRTSTTSVSNIRVQLTSTDNAAPQVTAFTLPTGTQKGTLTATVTVTDPAPSSGIAKVELFEGSASLGVQTAGVGGTYTFSVDTTKLRDGERTLRAVVTDNVGLNAEKTATLTVDNAAPVITWNTPSTVGATGTLTLNATTETGSTLTYTASCGTITGSTWDYTTCTDGSAATLTATATDAAGNTTIQTRIITVDRTAPTVQITGPQAGQKFTQNPITVTVNGTDNVGIERIELHANGAPIGTVNGAQGSITWAPTSGTYTLTATATDRAGNKTTTQIDNVQVALASSSVITPDAPTITGTIAGTNPIFVRGLGSVQGSATSTAGITSGQLIVDGQGASTPTATSNGTPVTFNFDFNTLNEGLHDLGIRWTDAASVVTDSPKVSVYVDKTAPVITWNKPTNGSITGSGSIALEATATDAASGLATLTYSENGTAITTPSTWTPSEGMHTVTATATDKVGNVSSQNVTFTVDQTGPTITATSPTNGQEFTTTPVTISATATDNLTGVKSMEATIQGPKDAAPVTLGVQNGDRYSAVFTPVDAGTYTVTFKALDAVGNPATTATRTFTYTVTTAPTEKTPSPVLSVVGSGPYAGNMSVNVSGNFDSLSQVDRMILQITDKNGVVDNTTYTTTQAQATFSVDTTRLTNGDAKLEVIAYTKTGLRGVSAPTTIQIQNILSPVLAVAAPSDGATVTTPSLPVRVTLTKNGDTIFQLPSQGVKIELLDSRGRVAARQESVPCQASVDGATYTCNYTFDIAALPADTYTVRTTADVTVNGAAQQLVTTSRFTSNTTSVLPPAATIRFPAITSMKSPARIDSSAGFMVNVSDNTGVAVVEARIVGPFDATKPLALNGTTQCLESVPVGNPNDAVNVLLLNQGFDALVRLGDVILPNLDIDGSAYVPDNDLNERYDLRVTVVDSEGNRNIQCIPVTINRAATKAARPIYGTTVTTDPTPPNTTPGELNYLSGTWTLTGLTNSSRVAGVMYVNGVQKNISFDADATGTAEVTVSFGDEGVYTINWLVEDMTTGIVTSLAGPSVTVKKNK